MKRLIIAGGRDKQLTTEEFRMLDELLPVDEVVSGGATGVDTGGEIWARDWGIPVKRFPANWKKFGLMAGPLRNEEMAAYATHLAVFDGGKGTADMLRKAKVYGLIIHDFRTKK